MVLSRIEYLVELKMIPCFDISKAYTFSVKFPSRWKTRIILSNELVI